MCGIGAVYGGLAADEGASRAMATAMRHRGPDGDGFHHAGPATLVHTRLAIIDVVGGDQPLFGEDRNTSVVVNGEIYNHLELRATLEQLGHRFQTRSDSEVVVHAYEEWGIDAFRRLNGMFALVLWDERRGRLVAARDPYGVKPLYWTRQGDDVLIASEVRPLLGAGRGTASVDRIALEQYLAWRFVPSPRTMFAGVSKLPAANYLVVDRDGVRTGSFRTAPGPPLADASVDELTDGFRERFVAAVDRQLMSDVPLGAFLSGGLDSAAVVAAMRRSGHAAETFTIGFPGAGEFDERAASAATAKALGANHRDAEMREQDFLAQVEECVEALEEPCGTPSAPALLALSRFTAEFVTVVLSGQGADEPLGGYERAQAAAALSLADAIPQRLAGPVAALASRLPRNERVKRAAGLLRSPPGLPRMLSVFEITTPQLRRELLRDGHDHAADTERQDLATAVVADVEDRPLLDQYLYLDSRLFLPDNLLVYGDKMSMAASLEQRVPFLDLELMEYVHRIPGRVRVRGLRRKWLYRRAAADLVPAEVLRRKKHPFATPYDDWLRRGLGDDVRSLYRDDAPVAALVDPAVVGRLCEEHRSGRHDHKRILYCLLELGLWHRRFVDRPGDA